MTKTMVDCPRHEGAYDCTPFCNLCEGEQVYEYTPTRPCRACGVGVEHDTWLEELEMCVDCSNDYFTHDDESEEL